MNINNLYNYIIYLIFIIINIYYKMSKIYNMINNMWLFIIYIRYRKNEILKTHCGSSCYVAPEILLGQSY